MLWRKCQDVSKFTFSGGRSDGPRCQQSTSYPSRGDEVIDSIFPASTERGLYGGFKNSVYGTTVDSQYIRRQFAWLSKDDIIDSAVEIKYGRRTARIEVPNH